MRKKGKKGDLCRVVCPLHWHDERMMLTPQDLLILTKEGTLDGWWFYCPKYPQFRKNFIGYEEFEVVKTSD